MSEAGGLGFLAAGYLSADALGERIARTRALTDAAVRREPVRARAGAPRRSVFADYVAGLEAEGLRSARRSSTTTTGTRSSRCSSAAPVAVVSFTFGLPGRDVIARVRATGAEAWVTVTSPEEARAAAAGATRVVVQGAEAGGHRGSWVDHDELSRSGCSRCCSSSTSTCR